MTYSKSQKADQTTAFHDVMFEPFESVPDAWFWFITAQQARNDGARFVAGTGAVPRPCEPVDILKVVDGLYRARRLMRDHLLVMRHYGRRQLAPDRTRVKEQRAHVLWVEAMEMMAPIMERKNIVRPQSWVSHYVTHADMQHAMAAE